MGTVIAIEGLDGAGKNTLADALCATLRARGASVTRWAFPRYGRDVHADLARQALQGEHGDLASSVYAMAVLFALDRAGAAEALRADRGCHDVVLLDRYVASNAAYGAARLGQDAAGEYVSWVYATEVARLQVPAPDAHILLDVGLATAAGRAQRREQDHPQRRRDRYETDGALQERTGAVYAQLAARAWLAPWYVCDGSEPRERLCPQVLDWLEAPSG